MCVCDSLKSRERIKWQFEGKEDLVDQTAEMRIKDEKWKQAELKKQFKMSAEWKCLLTWYTIQATCYMLAGLSISKILKRD